MGRRPDGEKGTHLVAIARFSKADIPLPALSILMRLLLLEARGYGLERSSPEAAFGCGE